MITRVDHVTISVCDFPASLSQYASLLGQPARAQASEPGRRAALFVLCNAHILLLEVAEGEAQGVTALGLAGTDAHSCIAELQARGVGLERLEDHPAGIGVAGLWEIDRACTRGIAVRIVDRLGSVAADSFRGEQVEALDHVVIRSAAMDQAVAFYGGTLGMRLALDRELGGVRMLFFRTGGVTLEVIADSAAEYDTFYGVAYRVRDPQAAHLRLTAAGFALTDIRAGRKPGTQVFSTRSGVPTLFIRDPSRD